MIKLSMIEYKKLMKKVEMLEEVLSAAEKIMACPPNNRISWEGAWSNMMYHVDGYRREYKDD